MLNYEAELKKFQPISELDDVEDLVMQYDLTDMTDLMKQMLAQKQAQNRQEKQ